MSKPSLALGQDSAAASTAGEPARLSPQRLLPLLAALVAAGVVFFPVTRSYFYVDDFFNLQSIVNDPLPRYLLQPTGGHLLVFRNLLYVLFHRAFGVEPAGYFRVVLLTHLLNVGLLYEVLRRLTRRPALAGFGAALWGIMPVHEGALAWYAVYGHVVVGTILLVILLRLARLVAEDAPLGFRDAVCACGLLLLASLSFGVGIGIALVAPAVAFLLFPGRRAALAARLLLLALPPALYFGYRWLIHLQATLYGGTAEVQVIFLIAMLGYWQAIVGMFLHLLAIGASGLMGSFAVSVQRYPEPLAFVLVGLFLAGLLVAFVRAPSRERRLMLALAVLALGSYAIIAAGRASMHHDQPVFGAAKARYHYVATMPLAVLLCLALARLRTTLAVPAAARTALLAVWVAITGVSYARSAWRIDTFEWSRRTTEAEVRKIAEALASAPRGAPVYLTNEVFPPAAYQRMFAGRAALYTIYFPEDAGRPVYFVEKDPAVRALASPGSRLSRVLVASEGTP